MIKNLILKLNHLTFHLAFVIGILTLFVPTSASAGTLVKPANNLGLVGYWSFNEATGTVATDFSGRGSAGTLNSFAAPATASSGWGSGKLGSALIFDGGSDYVDMGNTSPLNVTSTGSISLWVKIPPSAGSSDMVIAGNLNWSSDTNGYVITQCHACNNIDGQLQLELGNGTGASNSAVYSNGGYNDNNWHLVTGTWDGTNSRIYVDGVLNNTPVTQTTPISNVNNFIVGRDAANVGHFFTGSVDEVRVYSRALSATDVANLYKVGVAKINSSQNNLVKNGLVGWWTFDGGDFTDKIYDRSGQGNNAYLLTKATTSAKAIGKSGQAVDTTGANGGMYTVSSNDLNNFTVSSWAYNTSSSGDPYIASRGASFGAGYNYYLWYNRDNTICGTSNNWIFGFHVAGDTWYDHCYTSSLPLNEWHYYTTTYDGANIKLYIDGVLVKSDAETHTPDTTTSAPQMLRIGNEDNAAAWFGKLDEVRVYNRALSANEITLLYQASNGKTNTSVAYLTHNTTLESGLVGYWSFDGLDVTDKIYDRSGSGFNGYLYNGPTTTAKAVGKQGQGLRFDGTNDFSRYDLTSLGTMTTGTISAWVYWNSSASYTMFIEGTIGQSTPSIEGDSGGISFFVNNSCDIPFGTVSTKAWHHLVGTWDGTNGRSYLDGNLINTISCTQSNAMQAFTIGGRGDGTLSVNGRMDEVRLYNRALSTAEVKLLYNMGK